MFRMKREEDVNVNVDEVGQSVRPSQETLSHEEEFDSFIDRTLILRNNYLFQRLRLLRIGLLDW